jgi:nucleoid-associated protein YgaU
MTRETKIGLLVGLIFIFAFGLILGRRSQDTPDANAQVATSPPVYDVVPVLSPPRELAARASTPAVAEPNAPGLAPPVRTQTQFPDEWIHQPAALIDQSASVQHPAPITPGETPVIDPRPARPTAPQRVYVVESGDNLIKIAREVYNDGGKYKLIYEANRDQLPTQNSLKVGQELKLPVLDTTPGPAPVQIARRGEPAVREMSAEQLRQYMQELPAAQSPRRAAHKQYTVQRGDSLTAIARRMLGDDSPEAIKKLYEANKDKLSSPDDLRVGEVLVLPG